MYVFSVWLHRLFGEVFTETTQALERRVRKLEEAVVCVAAQDDPRRAGRGADGLPVGSGAAAPSALKGAGA